MREYSIRSAARAEVTSTAPKHPDQCSATSCSAISCNNLMARRASAWSNGWSARRGYSWLCLALLMRLRNALSLMGSRSSLVVSRGPRPGSRVDLPSSRLEAQHACHVDAHKLT